MGYKTILVHVDDSKHARKRIEYAAKLAALENSHLVGIAITGVTRYLSETAAVGVATADISPFLDTLRERAAKALEEFASIAQLGRAASIEKRMVDSDAVSTLVTQAHYSDLVVLGQYDPDEARFPADEDLTEIVTLSAGRPVLVIPYATHLVHTIGRKPLVAWNASLEATRAVYGALPLLQRATTASAIMFSSSPDTDTDDIFHATELAAYLARHGVKAEVKQEYTGSDIGDALISLTANLPADLLVMGCYGRSRFREVLLGGATRTVLKSMTVPVLMCH